MAAHSGTRDAPVGSASPSVTSDGLVAAMDTDDGNDDSFEVGRKLPTTAGDVTLHYLPVRLTWDEYVAWLQTLPQPTYEQLRSLPISIGEPFSLDS
jgi:hypothetical protein